MATSGSYSYQLTNLSAIEEAFSRCQIPEDDLTPRHFDQALRSLQLMLNDWMNDDVHLWTVNERYSVSPSQGDNSFALPTGSIDVLEMTLVDGNGYETPMVPIGRQEYQLLYDKDQQGRPDRYYVDRGISTKTCYFWQAMDSSGYTLSVNILRLIEDAGNITQDPSAPAQFYDAICAGLAGRLATKFVSDRAQRMELKAEAEKAYARAKMGNRERGDTIMSYRMGGGRRRRA